MTVQSPFSRLAIPRIAWAAYGFALAIIVLDQLTKAWVLDDLSLREVGRVFVAHPVFNLSYVENSGFSFGLAGGGAARWPLSIFSIVVAGGLAWWATQADRRLLIASIGLLIGGAIGNVIDRVRFGYVVDFLDFSGTRFPEVFFISKLAGNPIFPWVFNVADCAISVGVALLILDTILSERKPVPVGAAPEKS